MSADAGRTARRRVEIVAPMHPIFVHFTVALTTASLGFDTAGVLAGAPSLLAAGWWSLAAAAVLTVGTAVSGVVSRLRLPMEEGAARRFLRAHMALGMIVLGAVLTIALWRAVWWERMEPPSVPYLVAMGATLLIVTVQGYMGGELVYRFGAEVAGDYRRLPLRAASDGSRADGDAATVRPS